MAKTQSPAKDPLELTQRLGITVHQELLLQSLTHKSYAYENGGLPDNERLEFLGDSVLGRAVTLELYRQFPTIDEGELANRRAGLVSTVALAEIARTIQLGDFLRLGRGEENTGGRDKDSLLADTTEALIGAHFLSVGDPESAEFVLKLVAPLLARQNEPGKTIVDPKTWLQEFAAEQQQPAPHYHVTGTGPDHNRTFTAEVIVAGKTVGTGTGSSKKQAELNAAAAAALLLDPQKPEVQLSKQDSKTGA